MVEISTLPAATKSLWPAQREAEAQIAKIASLSKNATVAAFVAQNVTDLKRGDLGKLAQLVQMSGVSFGSVMGRSSGRSAGSSAGDLPGDDIV